MPLYTSYLVLGYWPLGPVSCEVSLPLYGVLTDISSRMISSVREPADL